MKQLIKGITSCNRTACQKELVEGAIYYNKSTDANYCPYCAYLINKHNTDLCKLQPPKEFNKEKFELEIIEMTLRLKNMYPKDGLNSPRDIELVHDINRWYSYITDIENNVKELK